MVVFIFTILNGEGNASRSCALEQLFRLIIHYICYLLALMNIFVIRTPSHIYGAGSPSRQAILCLLYVLGSECLDSVRADVPPINTSQRESPPFVLSSSIILTGLL